MDESFNTQLVSLLEDRRESPDVYECLKLIGKQETRFQGYTDAIPIKEVIDIYRTRSKINSELFNGIIKGYETLLPALETADVQSVRIHILELLSKSYWIFTDEAVSNLFGLLDRPKKKVAWWSDPVSGYDID
jgi:hypothetical protein